MFLFLILHLFFHSVRLVFVWGSICRFSFPCLSFLVCVSTPLFLFHALFSSISNITQHNVIIRTYKTFKLNMWVIRHSMTTHLFQGHCSVVLPVPACIGRPHSAQAYRWTIKFTPTIFTPRSNFILFSSTNLNVFGQAVCTSTGYLWKPA